MKILFILPEYYPHSGGGISTYYQHYLQALKPHCETIKVIVGSGYVQGRDKFEHNGIEVAYLDPELYQQHLLKFTRFNVLPEYRNNLAAAWAMWEQAKEGDDFDVIECTDFGLGFVPWVMHHQKPVITRLHGSAGQIALHENTHEAALADNINLHTEATLLPLCDILLTHSQANREFWQSVFPSGDISFIPPVYTAPQISEPLPLEQRENWGLVAARMQKWKGPEVLCKAMRLVKTGFDIKWMGRDTPFNKGQSTNAYLSLNYGDVWGKRIFNQNAVPNGEMLNYQRQARFGIVPSLWDMFNFSCLEFMAVGTPLICADGAGASELIEHGINGFKYDANDPTALAACIDKVISLNEPDYKQMAYAAMQTIAGQLSSASRMPDYLQLYQRAIKAFEVMPSNDVFAKLYGPGEANDPLGDLLDKQPLKLILSYLKARILQKKRK
ncbi:glycosyltransferase family 4 protein [Mucilaginibacter calamicampi]|uniref:Glycosyltransferase family 4 protein n=1 Tax=Mucilaginibacter calamicampi TaxID=1302352 RepID=A0ABW2YTU4_9SPHI